MLLFSLKVIFACAPISGHCELALLSWFVCTPCTCDMRQKYNLNISLNTYRDIHQIDSTEKSLSDKDLSYELSRKVKLFKMG